MGCEAEEELCLPVKFRGEVVEENGYRIDLLVEKSVIVEVKSVETMKNLFSKQLGTYLKLTGMRLGLLINFNEVMLRDGIKRIMNNFPE